ncbi:Phosphoglucomutase [Operophtera brumata]|uniref:Phosphoglucomutase n=1 Tax=Operophtera brumata TaxID=104452 RepID=A0A0L7LMT4_OPEBR|nr:Phosphoglucomutase [Operophtera brumata]
MTAAYMAYIRDSLHVDGISDNKQAAIDIVYSAMHGVGYEFVVKALETANLKRPISVAQQQEPDPEFPTVTFPNPEEAECLVLSKALAERAGAALLFTGNEMGALLGWWLLQQYYKRHPTASEAEVYVLASIVSSKMLRAIVQGRGQFVETLTGFKWMGKYYKRHPTASEAEVYVLASIVSSKMLRAIVQGRGQFVETLTGFKWMGKYYKRHPTASEAEVYVLASIVSSKMLRAIVQGRGQFVETLTGFKWMGKYYKRHPTASEAEVYVLASIVSSKMLRAIVQGRGQFVETLTGFKWMGKYYKRHPTASEAEVYVLASIVSSKMLRAIVQGRGQFVETLTGFKWMGKYYKRHPTASEAEVYVLASIVSSKMLRAIVQGRGHKKAWKLFTGNEMGALLGWWLLQQYYKRHPTASEAEVYVLASIVSSKMLRAIVQGRGQFVETLTGFKWMGNTTLLLQQQGKVPLFAYEEAIGYMCDPRVPDKDGVSAAVHVSTTLP